MLLNCPRVFQSGCTISHSHHGCVGVPCTPHPGFVSFRHWLLEDLAFTATTGFFFSEDRREETVSFSQTVEDIDDCLPAPTTHPHTHTHTHTQMVLHFQESRVPLRVPGDSEKLVPPPPAQSEQSAVLKVTPPISLDGDLVESTHVMQLRTRRYKKWFAGAFQEMSCLRFRENFKAFLT